MTDLNAPINVLLVDDLEENLVALKALLQREGLSFLLAKSGDEALELLLIHDVALALLDVQMPGMDGFQLAEFMRGSERSRHVPIIFVTAGSADAQRRFRGYEAGAVDFIQKPIESDVLRSKAEVFFELYLHRRQVVAQRDELDAYARALRAADENKNRFLAVLGHELRNPVMALRAGLALMDREGQGAEDLRNRMEVQVGHLARLVDDLLDISRIDQGKIALRTESVILQPVLQIALEGIRHKVEMGDHALQLEIPDDPIPVVADSTRLAQIVGNLLGNAAKYTPRGGLIRMTVELHDDEVRIEIADNGVGIPLEMQARVFDLYTQLEGPDFRSRDGLGIGLALVKQLVELHGGRIAVQSAGSGKGSAFTVALPRPVGAESILSPKLDIDKNPVETRRDGSA